MVHALEKTHGLLKPGGILLENHFTGGRTVVEVHREGQIRYSAPVRRKNGFEAFTQAKAAIDTTVNAGLFVPACLRFFDHCVHAETFVDLRVWMDDQAKSLSLSEQIAEEIEELEQQANGHTQIVMRRRVRMGRLKRS